jgi:hypothetical protein
MNKKSQKLFDIRRGFLPLCIMALLSMLSLSVSAQVGSPFAVSSIKIIGSSKPKENSLTTFSALGFDRRVRNSADGYTPSAQFPVRWTEPPQVHWDFGDGTVVPTGEALNVNHIYLAQGSYTLTVTMSDSEGIYASGTREVVVDNDEPDSLRVAAAKGENAGEMVFTASAQDAPEDELTFIWDLGDGTTREGVDLWQINHQYLIEGIYEVKLKVVDDDGASASDDIKVKVAGGTETNEVDWQARDENAALEDIIHGMNAQIDGGLKATMKPELAPLAGVLLGKIKNGDCRLAFSSWSNSQLMYGMFLLDFPVIPPGGARYQFSKPKVGLVFTADQSAYLLQKRANPHSGIVPAEVEPLASTSPFGFETSEGYSMQSGAAEIEFVPREYVKGSYDVVLKSSPEDTNPIRFKADFAFDLKNSNGHANYDGCDEAPPLKIISTYPEIDTQHLYDMRPDVRVSFDQSVDPASVTNTTFELGYPDANGTFTPVAGRILRRANTFYLVPNLPLRSAVRYTVRLKGGETGIKGSNGAVLDDVDSDEWHRWEFTSKIDFNTQSNGKELLSCHVYQTVRDAPLIAGKPAVVRVDANWSELPEIDPAVQLKKFQARVVLIDSQRNEIVGQWHQFVRPDLWKKNGLDITAAEQSALITIPSVDKDLALLSVNLHVRSLPGKDPSVRYFSRCPVEIWDKKPTLTVDLFALRTDEWFEDEAYQAVLPVIGRLSKEIEDYAWQQFPVAEIKVSSQIQSVVPVNKDGFSAFLQDAAGLITDKQAADKYLEAVKNELKGRSSADIILLLVPHNLFEGGKAHYKLSDGQALVHSLINDDPANFSRYVFAAVHEFGHALTLEHLPAIETAAERELVINQVLGGGAVWFGGIEGIRMSRDGADFWLKSSVSGNQESGSILPLMFPKTRNTNEAFITHHQYRLIQKFLEN